MVVVVVGRFLGFSPEVPSWLSCFCVRGRWPRAHRRRRPLGTRALHTPPPAAGRLCAPCQRSGWRSAGGSRLWHQGFGVGEYGNRGPGESRQLAGRQVTPARKEGGSTLARPPRVGAFRRPPLVSRRVPRPRGRATATAVCCGLRLHLGGHHSGLPPRAIDGALWDLDARPL